MIHRLLGSIAVFLFLLTSCRADDASFIQPGAGPTDLARLAAEALSAAADGNAGPLESLARGGGTGAWFALAAAAEESGYLDIAQTLLIRSAKEDDAPFGPQSLAAVLLDDPRAIRRPLAALRKAERLVGARESLQDARIAVLAAAGRDRVLRKAYDGFTGRSAEAPVMAAVLAESPDDPGIRAVAERYILHCSDPAALTAFPRPLVERLGSEAASLHRARVAFARGRYGAALPAYREWMDFLVASQAPCPLEGVPPVFAEIAQGAAATESEEDWIGFLSAFAEEVGGSKRYGAMYQVGRLYRGQKDFRAASAAFAAAAEAMPAGLEKDRAHWYRLRTMYESASLSTLEESEAWAAVQSSWEAPRRFSDQLAEYLHRRVRRGEWALLQRTYQERGGEWPGTATSAAALALAFAVNEGRLPRPDDAGAYLETAFEAAPLSWPGLRAAGLLSRIPPIPPTPETSAAPSHDAAGPEETFENAAVRLYLKWGLIHLAGDSVLAAPGLYGDETVRATARALAPTAPRRSIHVIGVLFRREGYQPTRDDLLLRYPLPYGNLAARAAENEGVPPEIFHGLIRTESAWDAAAISRSGAQGLAQFMPATWDEWTRRMRLPENADPLDPETNLLLGAAYLNWLYQREWTFGWVDSLASYNAGGGRVRSWRRERPEYGDHLFGLSLPVEEPRSYIGKVLSAATLYGYLYADRSPRVLHEDWELEMIEVN